MREDYSQGLKEGEGGEWHSERSTSERNVKEEAKIM